MPAIRALTRRGHVLAAVALTAVAFAGVPPARADSPRAELGITRIDTHGHSIRNWILTCGPDGGTHPDPWAACGRLRQIGGDLDRIRYRPGVVLCPLVYDPVRVDIMGHVSGRLVLFDENYPNACFADGFAGPILPVGG